jgi:hypothetical protein
MSAPHNLLFASGGQMEALYGWIGQHKIVTPNRERVVSRAARFESYNNAVFGRRPGGDFEIQKAFGAQF